MEPLESSPAHHVLDDVLGSVRLQSIVYCRSVVQAPWGFSVIAKSVGSFTIVNKGGCWLEIEDENLEIWLSAGDFVVLPHGHAHSYRDAPTSTAIPITELLASHPIDPRDSTMRFGGDGQQSVIVCGAYLFEERKTNPLLQSLPVVIHVRASEVSASPPLSAALDAIEAEVVNNRPGSHTIVARWAEILFLHAVRIHIDRKQGAVNWISGLRDPQISRALSAMHRAPERAWSISQLANDVGMSRSAFAGRFSEIVGETPMHYLTLLRMNKAASLLKLDGTKLLNIAEAVGYESETSFSKAFKRWVGVSPGAYRDTTINIVALAMSSRPPASHSATSQ